MTRTRCWLLAMTAVLTMTAASGIRNAHAQTSFYGSASSGTFSISFFYDELDNYGHWIDYGNYGTCWVPADVGYGWRPYSRGHWIYTDYGWTWASYEPFGWATYHYGRWVFDPGYGWVWVPGTVWAPAWVAWRESDDYIGWAPLPPQVGWNVSVGLTFGGYSSSSIGYDRWCFVDRRRFVSRDVSTIVYPVTRNATVWRTTRDETRFRIRGGSPVNDAISIANVERSVGQRIPRMRVRAVDSPTRGQGRPIDARTVGFFRPSIRGSRSDFNRATEGRVEPQHVDWRGGNRFETRATEQPRSNRIQRDIERVQSNGRNRSNGDESRNVERTSRVRVERPADDLGRQRAPREVQRPERGFDGREVAPDRSEVRDVPRQQPDVQREQHGRDVQREQPGRGQQEVRSRERGNRESSNDNRGKGRGKGSKKDDGSDG
jgi:hypothetical protein